jgi:hypothetical protein
VAQYRPNVIKRIFRNGRRLGNDDGDRLAYVTHLLVGDHRLVERFEVRERLQTQSNARNFGVEILCGQNAVDPRQLQRTAGIDTVQATVRDGRAQNHRGQLPWSVNVGDISPSPAQEAEIFGPLDRLPDVRIRNSHSWSPFWA